MRSSSGNDDGGATSSTSGRGDAAATDWFSAKNCLLGVGTACLLGMVHFYKRKHTAGFKTCWAVMWPTLGGGIMLAVQPDEQQAARRVPPEELAKRRAVNDAIRRMAAGQTAASDSGGSGSARSAGDG